MRHALIAGGTGGIGQGIAADLLAQGWRVTLVSRSTRAPLLEAAGADWVSADCTQPSACAALGLRSPIDALIVATGGHHRVPLMEETPQGWRQASARALDPVLWLAQAILPGMMERRWGRILSFTMAGPRAAPMVSAERVARAGLQVLMRDLAQLGAPHGVTANCLKLGFVNSGSSVAPAHLPLIPAGRQGRVDEVVSAARLLLSDEGAYINGAEIPVSGGYGV